MTPLTLFDEDDMTEAPLEPHVRVRFVVAYDGTGFHGFAVNPGVRTVGGVLTEALERVLRHPVALTCAGRTDKGVHAHGQVIDFLTTEGVDVPALTTAINSLCGPEIAVRDGTLADLAFSSRFDAVFRRYRYTIHHGEVPDPFTARTAWHVKDHPDLALLRLGCDPLIGTHDFTSFCRRPKVAPEGEEVSLVRDVHSAHWEVVDDETLRFWIQASSFCHQMVRSIVGTLVEVGTGRKRAGDVRGILGARSRAAAGAVAPPHGLTLWEVGYASAPSTARLLVPGAPT